MRTLQLNKKMLTIKGENIKQEVPTPGVMGNVVGAIKNYQLTSTDQLKSDFIKWQERLNATEKKDMEARDYILIVLGSKFKTEHSKESFWTSELGILIADDKNEEIEISEDKYNFLKRIMTNNKTIQRTPNGEQEVDVFFPYELGQIIALFEEDEEAPMGKKKNK